MMRFRDPMPPDGTIPHLDWRVRQANREWRFAVANTAVLAALYTWLGGYGWVRPLFTIGLVLSGWNVRGSWRHLGEAKARRWTAETVLTMNGMAASGLYTMRQAIEAMRDGPVPPGVKRDEWVTAHNDMLAALAERGIEDDETEG